MSNTYHRAIETVVSRKLHFCIGDFASPKETSLIKHQMHTPLVARGLIEIGGARRFDGNLVFDGPGFVRQMLSK